MSGQKSQTFRLEPIAGVPYKSGKVDNDEGRVSSTNIYAVGWAKRGLSGVIRSTNWQSAQVHAGENIGQTDTHVIFVELKGESMLTGKIGP